jgi:putative flippase GtrA
MLRSLEARVRAAFHELAKFGTVGALAFVVLNRAWSFRHRQRSSVRREYTLFFVLNAVGLVIAVGCLGLSHYVLGFHSRLADNIAGNGFGVGLGTLFRFWSYRKFVWAAPEAVEEAAVDGDAAAAAVLEDIADGTLRAPKHAAKHVPTG